MSNHLPRHIAIIPDGNRRWARAHNKKASDGHEAGAKRIEELSHAARESGVYALSFWGSSLENLSKRTLAERRALLAIYKRYFHKLITDEDVFAHDVRINVIGRWEEHFPRQLVTTLRDGIEKTKNHKKHLLNFFLAYSGDDEMLLAVQKIAGSGIAPSRITKKTVKQNLMTKDLPPVDFLIRTGGEPHLSAGFMMWDIADSELYFSKKFFPDFDKTALHHALSDYDGRRRKRGT